MDFRPEAIRDDLIEGTAKINSKGGPPPPANVHKHISAGMRRENFDTSMQPLLAENGNLPDASTNIPDAANSSAGDSPKSVAQITCETKPIEKKSTPTWLIVLAIILVLIAAVVLTENPVKTMAVTKLRENGIM